MKSGMELERSLTAIKAIDELISQNRNSDAELIRNELNNGTASAAENCCCGSVGFHRYMSWRSCMHTVMKKACNSRRSVV